MIKLICPSCGSSDLKDITSNKTNELNSVFKCVCQYEFSLRLAQTSYIYEKDNDIINDTSIATPKETFQETDTETDYDDYFVEEDLLPCGCCACCGCSCND